MRKGEEIRKEGRKDDVDGNCDSDKKKLNKENDGIKMSTQKEKRLVVCVCVCGVLLPAHGSTASSSISRNSSCGKKRRKKDDTKTTQRAACLLRRSFVRTFEYFLLSFVIGPLHLFYYSQTNLHTWHTAAF